MKIKLLITALMFSASFVKAQNLFDVVYTNDKHIPAYLSIKEDVRLSLKMKSKSNSDALKGILHLNNETTAVLIDTLTDRTGGFHESYTEYYKGFKVDGTRCNIHYDKDGKPEMINGNFRTIEKNDTVARISSQEGFQQALKHAGINIGTRSEYPKAEKVIYVKDDIAYLTYKYKVDAFDKDFHSWVYVDVLTGKIIDSVRAVCNIGSSVTTVYSGLRMIESQYYNSSYRLRDYTRGNGIETYAFSYYNPYTNTYIGNDYTSPDFSWNSMTNYDRAALDVHWGVEMTYDYYYNKFGRNSYDNQGSVIRSFVNYPDSNAYWTGNEMVFGEANSIPWVSLDITAHELTHAFTQSSSNLRYQAESGAINEGMSDVFATCVEQYAKPNNGYNIWLIGEDVVTLRDMGNPTCKYYHGTGWIDTSNPTVNNDQGGVHTNSGIFNYWFYQLVNGTNTETYTVDSIGFDKAINICYLMNASYLTPNATFHDAARCSILTAAHLGFNDTIEQIINAWKNVGVYVYPEISGPTIITDTASYVINYIPEGWNVTWQLNPVSSIVSLQTLPNDSLGRACCMLVKDPRYPYEGYIQATLSHNNDTITTLSKKLYGHLAKGRAYYVVRKYPGNQVVDAALIPPGNIIKYIKVGDRFNYSSPNFKGMRGEEDVWHPNSIPYCVTRDEDSDNFTIWPQSTGYVIYRLINREDPNYVYVFVFNVEPASKGYSMLLTKSGNNYQVKLVGNENMQKVEDAFEDEIAESRKITTDNNLNSDWTLEVYDSTSAKPRISTIVRGNTTSFDTNGWAQGLYIVKAIVKGNTLTEKIIIDNK